MQVLIADDDPVARELLRSALEETGYEVVVATDGRQAIDILMRGSCRLVVSDWEMPEMDGIELCRAIRSGELGRYVYTILLTCRDGTDNVVAGLSAGADDFLSKPFEPAELGVRLRAGERILSLETRDLVIFAMARLAESRDPETGRHLERVRAYSRVLAEEVAKQDAFAGQIDAGFIGLLYRTSPLHDIGKIGIPDYVLLKPGRLDDREFEIMKTHAAAGAATLGAAVKEYPDARFLRMARDIAGNHHERHDGGGYPNGLVGDDIPLCARVFSVADVYDALVSRRVYKSAFTHDVAVGIIREGTGTQFAPEIAEAFLRCEGQFREIASEWQEYAWAGALETAMTR